MSNKTNKLTFSKDTNNLFKKKTNLKSFQAACD